MKTCTKCSANKSNKDFYWANKKQGLRHSACKVCENTNPVKIAYQRSARVRALDAARQRQRHAENPEKRRSYMREYMARPDFKAKRRKYAFNLTEENYTKILLAQNSCCAICGSEDPGGAAKEWLVDHDHACCPGRRTDSVKSCGKCIRGLLCSKCNFGLGQFKDDPNILQAAIEYIKNPIARELLNT